MSDGTSSVAWAGVLRSHLERCLQDVWEQHELHVDVDGDYPYRVGTAACWVGLTDDDEPIVRVFAHAALGLKPSAKLLTELNDVNSRARWVRVYLDHGVVVVDTELHWTQLTRERLDHALRAVSFVADDIGMLVATVHGGSTPFEPETPEPSHDEAA